MIPSECPQCGYPEVPKPDCACCGWIPLSLELRCPDYNEYVRNEITQPEPQCTDLQILQLFEMHNA